MKKQLLSLAVLMTVLSLSAQETYENAKLVGDDLNGTARYVGMGGAMEALGADISTISSNPAGLGLYRHSMVNASGSLNMQSGAPSYAKGDKTTVSFDQIGFVYSLQTRPSSYINFAFNYHKSKNFNYILAAANSLNNASQNKLTYQKARNGVFTSDKDITFSQVDALYMGTDLYDRDENVLYNDVATSYQMNREHEGYVADYDFSINGNINNRVFLGLAFSVKDVNYKHYGTYTEQINGNPLTLTDDRRIDGSGFDLKAGVIVRPIENSPFRIGAYVHTPTWYDLTTENYSKLTGSSGPISESYDYKMTTPWKFGFALGHTIGNNLAFGATYEYADYSSTKTRIKGLYGDFYEDTQVDREMNNHTESTLKGVSTIKVGAEYKPLPELAIRAGYNYVSPKYESDGFKAVDISSPGVYYSSATDYTNWKATNRLTFGVGYQIDKFNIDLSYQCSMQKGDFTPFTEWVETEPNEMGVVDHSQDNIAGATSVKNNRHQVMLTLGYHF